MVMTAVSLLDLGFVGILLLPVIFLLVFVCLTVKCVGRVRRGERAGVGNIICAGVTLAAGSMLAVYTYVQITKPPPPDHLIKPMAGIVGYDYNECREVYADYFDMEIEALVYSGDVPKGIIIEQSPREGTLIAVGDSVVYCVVSRGRRTANVPNVAGLDRETAEEVIQASGLKVSVRYEFSEDIPAGEVISASPEANTEIYWGDCVTLVVSAGNVPPQGVEE